MGVLSLLARASADRDLETYADCLDPSYRFWFVEDLSGEDSWDWVVWITKAQEMEITRNMFEAQRVRDIDLEMYNVTRVDGAEDDEDRFLERRFVTGFDTSLVYQADVMVNLHVLEEVRGETVDHWVHGMAEVCVRPDPEDENLWTVWWIRDRTDQRSKAENTTWTALKIMFGS